jgi:hypothetical protein
MTFKTDIFETAGLQAIILHGDFCILIVQERGSYINNSEDSTVPLMLVLACYLT